MKGRYQTVKSTPDRINVVFYLRRREVGGELANGLALQPEEREIIYRELARDPRYIDSAPRPAARERSFGDRERDQP
jgi:hypothetical protein